MLYPRMFKNLHQNSLILLCRDPIVPPSWSRQHFSSRDSSSQEPELSVACKQIWLPSSEGHAGQKVGHQDAPLYKKKGGDNLLFKCVWTSSSLHLISFNFRTKNCGALCFSTQHFFFANLSHVILLNSTGQLLTPLWIWRCQILS